VLGVEGDVDGDEKSLATDICVAAEVVGYFTIKRLEGECSEWRVEAAELEEDWDMWADAIREEEGGGGEGGEGGTKRKEGGEGAGPEGDKEEGEEDYASDFEEEGSEEEGGEEEGGGQIKGNTATATSLASAAGYSLGLSDSDSDSGSEDDLILDADDVEEMAILAATEAELITACTERMTAMRVVGPIRWVW
jgi:hypothetical protein